VGPPPRACLFMTPARVPMSVSLLLEHVHGDPCPVVHAPVMSNRQRPGVRPRLRWRPRPCPRSGRSPDGGPRTPACDGAIAGGQHPATVRTGLPPCGACAAGPLRVACARPARVRMPDPPGGAGVLRVREGAGKCLVGGVAPGAGRSGRPVAARWGPVPDAHGPGRPVRSRACGTTAHAPLQRRAPPPPGPDERGPANGGEPVRVSPRAASGSAVPQGPLTHLDPGRRDRPAWADLPTPRCRPRRIRRRAGAAGKLA